MRCFFLPHNNETKSFFKFPKIILCGSRTVSIPTPWKAIGAGGFQQPKFIRQSTKLDWEFQGGRDGSNKKKPSMLEVWIFSGTTHFVSGLVLHISHNFN